MPIPNPGESQKDYVARCMNYPETKSKYPDNKQRVAVCYGLWKEHKRAHSSLGEMLAENVANKYGLCPMCGAKGMEECANNMTKCEAGCMYNNSERVY